ncbi:MAG: hypothetical protein GY859_08965 [Desulfobacterales bacterium]|nr:hypothetical protein [Desulfobacterales bacterium]
MGKSDQETSPLQRVLMIVLAASLTGGAILLAAAAAWSAFGGLLARMALTCIGAAAGALLMSAQAGALGKRSKMVAAGFAAIALSQISFLILVWTGWRVHSVLWRIWWVTMVPSVFVTHLLILRSRFKGRWKFFEWSTAISVFLAGMSILLLGLRQDFFADPGPLLMWIAGAPSAWAVIGSFYLYFRWLLGTSGSDAIAKRTIIAATLMSHLIVALIGFYIGRATVHRETLTPKQIVEHSNEDVKKRLKDDLLDAKASVATYMADTYLAKRPPYITRDQAARVEPMLKPGDILLVRRDWKLSNPWLQGFWTHAALYVGAPDDLQKLGVADDPAVKKHLEGRRAPAADGSFYTVIEALGEGVILNSLPRTMFADYAAALRPRLSDERIALAVIRAFSHIGKPYDFDFDFDDTDKLICTQVIYLSFEGMLDFELRQVMGRPLLTPLSIARKFATEQGRADRRLDFVLFLDADLKTRRSRFSSEEEFRESIHRPRALPGQ